MDWLYAYQSTSRLRYAGKGKVTVNLRNNTAIKAKARLGRGFNDISTQELAVQTYAFVYSRNDKRQER